MIAAADLESKALQRHLSCSWFFERILLLSHRSQPRPVMSMDQFLDNTLRIVRMRGPKLEGRLNIFARRINGSDDADNDADNVDKSNSENEDDAKAGPESAAA